MRKKTVLVVAGARPNFIKIAPIIRALRATPNLRPKLVHTGQHYDYKMSRVFFRDLGIPRPSIFLRVGSGSQAEQTAKVLESFEKTLFSVRPALVVVVGDVNSTLACALAASKLRIPVAHVEAGLRSFDRDMPEEINRVVVDRLSDYWFISEPSGVRNLKREGMDPQRCFWVGNVMIDSLVYQKGQISRSRVLERLRISRGSYAVATLHRPSNVDSRASLLKVLAILRHAAARTTMVFPIHPRTLSRIRAFRLEARFRSVPNLILTEPMGYTDFLKLVGGARYVLTDSGGIQEESTYLGVPCLTMRDNTERPITVRQGTNRLVGRDPKDVSRAVDTAAAGGRIRGGIPRFWDGQSAKRIAAILSKKI